MTVQSSFLIRCWITGAGSTPVKAYSIQHVQSGAEFRSADLAEVTRWMTGQNLLYVAEMLGQAGATGVQEDLQ